MVWGNSLDDFMTDNAGSFMHEEERVRDTSDLSIYICDGMFEVELVAFQFGTKNLEDAGTEHPKTNTW